MLTKQQENRIIRGGIITFWLVFWLLNVVDKTIGGKTILWAGKDRLPKFIEYFASIGINNPTVSSVSLIIISFLEALAFLFMILAFFQFIAGNKSKTRLMFFWGIFISLVVFSIFTMGDQVFGERDELLEHAIYWISLIISWFVFTHSESQLLKFEKSKKKK